MNQKGVTLLELLVSIVIGGMVFSVLFLVFQQVTFTHKRVQSEVGMHIDSRTFLTTISKSIENSLSAELPKDDTLLLTFRDPQGGQHVERFFYDSTERAVMRQVDSQPKTIACSNVATFQLIVDPKVEGQLHINLLSSDGAVQQTWITTATSRWLMYGGNLP